MSPWSRPAWVKVRTTLTRCSVTWPGRPCTRPRPALPRRNSRGASPAWTSTRAQCTMTTIPPPPGNDLDLNVVICSLRALFISIRMCNEWCIYVSCVCFNCMVIVKNVIVYSRLYDQDNHTVQHWLNHHIAETVNMYNNVINVENISFWIFRLLLFLLLYTDAESDLYNNL